MNSETLEGDVKETLLKAEMESSSYRLELEETQKKLLNLTKQLDSVLQCNCKLGVGMDYVIATVNELQSLMEWTAEKKETKADSAVIFHKLQQLERIQKDLEKTAIESEEIRFQAEQEKSGSLSCESYISSGDKDNYMDDPQSTEPSSAGLHDDQMALVDNSLENTELHSSSKSFDQTKDECPSPLLIDLNTPESEDIKIENVSPVDTSCSKNKSRNEYSHDSLGPNISEDEGLGDESRRGDSTGPSSFIEVQDLASLSQAMQCPVGNEIIITDPEGHQKTKDCLSDANPLDLCLCAIGNLRESLKTKENELLKLSAIKNDQKQIAALQEVILNFHKDTTHLKFELEEAKKENASLKEQVLELEEAENDARLQAQKLGEKLVFLQEKDSHFQAKLSDTKKALEKCLEELNVKELEQQELRSQLKYMEALVQKYEDQIRAMEIVELALRKKLIEEEDEKRAIEKSVAESKVDKIEKGTQMYDPSSNKSHQCKDEDANKKKDNLLISLDGKQMNDLSLSMGGFTNNVDICVQVPDADVFKRLFVDSYVQTETILLKSDSAQDMPVIVAPDVFKESNRTMLPNIECPIQKELFKRLHQLVEEDAHLQQQLHYVDQINLTLWKKLHNLEFHIGECKRKNMSEDCASDSCIESECDYLSSRPISREQIRDESLVSSKCTSPCMNRGIIACLDQSEQELKERLSKLEKINSSFEKELELREKLYIEKEKKYGEWVQTEQRFISDLKRLSDERDSLVNQVEQLHQEKQELATRVSELQAELDQTNERHRLETEGIKLEQQEIITKLQQKVDQLLIKEKEHLKQITNLKLEKSNLSHEKSESDKLKASYVELQLELSRTRDEVKKKEEEFRIRLDESRSKHVMEEARLISEIEMLRNKNSNCDELIYTFESRQNELMDIVTQKEHDLQLAREEHNRNMEATEEEHRAIEAELKRQLREMEEGTSVATRALTDERVRLEKELQENIDDLRSKEEVYKARISELESNVTHLHDELHRITGDIDSGFGSDINNDGITNFRREKLLNQLRELRDREAELREKLDEMEQKEAAYRETLEHADRIVASVEQGYKNKIEELEISERNLKQRVGQLEEEENRLRGALHKERRSSDGRKPDDLVVELLEAEARENGLKEKIETLEHLHRGLTSKVKDLEKMREKLESQVGDKDEVMGNLEKTQQELETARKSLAKLKKSESDLKSSLSQTEHALSATETQMKAKIRATEEEKRGLEETVDELRAQVRDLKHKLEAISNEKEERRISATLPSRTVSQTFIPPAATEIEEPDYVDVDECFPEPKHLSVKQHPAISENNLNKPFNVAPVNFTSPYNFKKTNPYPQEKVVKQAPITSAPDGYDNDRENLEHCMLRAMAAVKSDMQKKKLTREESKSRMKSLLSDSSNPENASRKITTEQAADEDNDYDEVLPRPTNFRVVQQVGSDTLLVGWNYVNTSILEGYEVYLDGQLHETVYTPDRTKALISGLNLKRPIRLSICALSRYGQMSDPTVLEVSTEEGNNSFQLQDEDDDDDNDIFEDSVYEKKRPYSMEW